LNVNQPTASTKTLFVWHSERVAVKATEAL